MRVQRSLVLVVSLLLAACGAEPGASPEAQGAPEGEYHGMAMGQREGPRAAAAPAESAPQSLATTVCLGATRTYGIDVSYYEGAINWASVKAAGKQFAYVRVSDGTGFIDPNFTSYWNGARAAGVTVGAYQFFRPNQDPIAQADLLVDKVNAVGGTGSPNLPPVIDVEVTGGLSSAAVAASVNAWLARVKARTGRTPVLYASPGFWDGLGDPTPSPLPYLWVAHWGVSCPSIPAPWGYVRFWQYTDSGAVSGISGGVDLDVYNGPLSEAQGLGLVASAPAPARRDLYAIARQNTGSGMTEVHALSYAAGYRDFSIHAATALGATGADASWAFLLGDYNGDGVPDLWAIKKAGTGTGTTEVHVLDGANWGQFLLHTGTALGQTGNSAQWDFALGDHDRDGKLDLYCINRSGGSGRLEVHVLSGASNFRSFIVHAATALAPEPFDGSWVNLVGDYNRDGVPDLILIHKTGTGSGMTEVHVLSGAGGAFQTWLEHVATALGPTGSDHQFDFTLTDYDGDGRVDVAAVKRAGTGSDSTELHILSGAARYGSFLLHTGTALHETGTGLDWAFSMR